MEMAEKIAIGGLEKEISENCPFKEELKGPSNEEGENIEKDDRDSVLSEQANNGGTLGKNLCSKSPGKSGTVGGPFPPPNMEEDKPQDTNRGNGAPKVYVEGKDGINSGLFPFTVAAHHLIPGEASLAPSELKKYMTQNESVQSAKGKTWKINSYIGYNVNGCHNGIWLPGNYAIRKDTSPTGQSWGDMTEGNWQMNYVAACAKAATGQFHDAHTKYSAAVEDLLNSISNVLLKHQETCDECKDKNEIPPPFLIKQRLYNLSAYFKTQLSGHPYGWKRPWFTSDRWRDAAFSGGKIKEEYVAAYDKAKLVKES